MSDEPLLMQSTRSQRGGALVEFAMIAPVLFMILIGSIEFGILIYQYHATNYAARIGARYASVHGVNCNYKAGPCPTTNAAINTYVLGKVPGLESGAAARPTWTIPPAATYTGITASNAPSKCDLADQNQFCLVTVTVRNPVTIRIPFIGNFHPTLTSTSTVPEQ